MSDFTPMTDAELAAIEARANAATPGDWLPEGERIYQAEDQSVYLFDAETGNSIFTEDDCRFIGHAREDVPKLLAEVRRLQELVDDLAAVDPNAAPEFGFVCRYCTLNVGHFPRSLDEHDPGCVWVMARGEVSNA